MSFVFQTSDSSLLNSVFCVHISDVLPSFKLTRFSVKKYQYRNSFLSPGPNNFERILPILIFHNLSAQDKTFWLFFFLYFLIHSSLYVTANVDYSPNLDL